MTETSTLPRVVVVGPIHDAGLERLRERFPVDLVPDSGAEEERAEALAHAQAIIIRAFRVDAALLDLAPQLGLIVKHGAGVDNIDIAEATARGVLVASTPGGANATSVGEAAVGLMIAVARRSRDMDALVREGRFTERWSTERHSLWGKRLGLVGFGRIARVTARICGAGLAMDVSAYDPHVPDAEFSEAGVERAGSLTGMLADADVVSIHVALGEGTRGLVGAAELAAMPPHAILVNTSRGGAVDEAALIAALTEGRLRGAGIDVFAQEPPDAANPLFALDNVVLSPHVAGLTEESVRDMALGCARAVADVVAGERPEYLLNPEIWDQRRL